MRNLYSLLCLIVLWHLSPLKVQAITMADGASCLTAVPAIEGINNVSLATEYWYSFTMPKNGKLLLTSASSINIKVFSGNCEKLSLEEEAFYGKLSVAGLQVGETIYVQWVAGGAATYSWELSIEDYAEGDLCSMASEAIEGENNYIMDASGSHWYSFTMPQDGKLKIKGPYYSSMRTYKGTCEGLKQISKGGANVTLSELIKGETVYIRMSTTRTQDETWELFVEGYAEGDLCSMASAAVEGVNTLTKVNGEHYWYSFTMPADGTLLISAEDDPPLNHIYLYREGCETPKMLSLGVNELSLAGRKKDEVIYIKWQVSANYSWDLSWELTVEEDKEGSMCSMASVAVEGENIFSTDIPINYWYSFTMPQDGKLVIDQENNNHFVALYKSCESGQQLREGSGNIALPGLKSGEVIYMHWQTTGAADFSWNLSIEENAEGDLCNQTATAAIGENIVPASNSGEYWYTFTMPQDGKLRIASESNKPVDVFYTTNCLYLKNKGFTNSGNLLVSGLTAGETMHIQWTSFRGGTISWNLSVEDYDEGEICKQAATAALGINTVPETNTGVYWYSFIMPQDGKLRIASETDVPVKVYSNSCEDMDLEKDNASGNLLMSGLIAGETVYLQWEASSGTSFSWNLSVEDYDEGEICKQAETAVVGTNEVPDTHTGVYWYSFTMPQDGKLRIVSETDVPVKVYSNSCETLHLKEGDASGNLLMSGLTVDETVYIQWEVSSEASFSWDLSVENYAEGELCRLPIVATLGTNAVPETDTGVFWYKFTVTEDGELRALSPSSVFVALLREECSDFIDTSTTPRPEVLLKDVHKEEEVYIFLKNHNESEEGFEWELSLKAYVEGDHCLRAVAALEGENVVPETDLDTYWYKFVVPRDGKLIIKNQEDRPINIYKNTCEEAYSFTGIGTVEVPDAVANEVYFVEVAHSEVPYSFIMEDKITGIFDNHVSEALSIYPNPATSTAHIVFNSNKKREAVEVNLVNMNGKKISTRWSLTELSDQKTVHLDMSGLEAGLYLVLINDGESLIKAKVLKY